MRLAVSNIAWPPERNNEAYAILKQHGIGAIEVAPTRFWPEWDFSVPSVSTVLEEIHKQGLAVSSLQAILFGKPELKVFGSDSVKQATLDHLEQCAGLANQLGACCAVFGAPKNRNPGTLSPDAAFAEAVEFFRAAARRFEAHGTQLCFEPNPAEYGCSFACDSEPGARLVRTVNSAGFRLHLDSACLHLAGEDACRAIGLAADVLSHFHVSEPFLGPFTRPVVEHRAIARTLRDIGYAGWVTLEMRSPDDPEQFREAVSFLSEVYGDPTNSRS